MLSRQPLVRAAMAARSQPTPLAATASRRAISTSAVRGAAASSSGSHAHTEESDDVYTPATFATPFFRNTLLAFLAVTGLYKLSNSEYVNQALNGKVPDPDTHEGDNRPYLTRWLDHLRVDRAQTRKDAIESLEFERKKAELNMIIKDAELEPVYRYRFPQRFDNYSPHCQIPGAQVDFSNVKPKRPGE